MTTLQSSYILLSICVYIKQLEYPRKDFCNILLAGKGRGVTNNKHKILILAKHFIEDLHAFMCSLQLHESVPQIHANPCMIMWDSVALKQVFVSTLDYPHHHPSTNAPHSYFIPLLTTLSLIALHPICLSNVTQ